VLSENTRALLKTAQDHDVPLRVMEGVITANDIRKRAMARKVAAAFAGSLRIPTMATSQRLGEAAKMPFRIHPHMLRHDCGYKLANDGHDTRA
jgi:hypothetical protein